MLDDLAIARLVAGRTATDGAPTDPSQLATLLAELRGVEGIALALEATQHGGQASFVEAFAWPADGRTCRRAPTTLATLSAAPVETIDGVTIFASRLAPVAFVGTRTLHRIAARVRFASPIGLATTAWICEPPAAALAMFAASVRDALASLGLDAYTADELLRPIAFTGPLDGTGSLMNLAAGNRVFDALFRWCD